MNEKKVGRPRLSMDEKTVATKVTIKESQLTYLQEVGNGNVSKGVRVVTDAYKEVENNKEGGIQLKRLDSTELAKIIDWAETAGQHEK